jgi:hypothetical protein
VVDIIYLYPPGKKDVIVGEGSQVTLARLEEVPLKMPDWCCVYKERSVGVVDFSRLNKDEGS